MDDKKWTKLKISLKKSIGENNFNNWLSPVEFSHVEEGVAIFTVPTNFLGNYVYQNFGEIIVAKVSTENSKINRIRFEVDRDSNNLGNSQPSAPAHINFPKDNELAGAHLDKRFTFDAFVVGKPNELAHAAARRVAERGDVSFNPLFLYGGVGLGKTHLMHAIAWELSNRRPDINALYLSAEQFMYRFVQALRERKMMDFKQLFRSVDILMVDDVQFIAGKGSTQEEFFHTFNALVDQNKQIINFRRSCPR
jgi:chromosomal replication initiator protein